MEKGDSMLISQNGTLTYKLSALETIGAFSFSPTASVENILDVKIVDNPWTTEVLRGIRAPGTGFPYLIMLGTMRHRKGKDFCVIYKRRPVIVLELKNEKFKRWVIPATAESVNSLRNLGLVNQPA